MSILIKGVGMPKDGERPYWVVIHSDGTVEYNKNNGLGWQTSEAIHIPPHGRLIDADALCEFCNNIIYHSATPNDIMRFPAIIPAERKTIY